MAISHADHNHPNTPAARAACRKATAINAEGGLTAVQAKVMKAAGLNVVARKRGDGGVVKATAAAVKNHKKPGTQLRTIGDLPDVPRMLAHGARLAWDRGWTVTVGHQFNDSEARLVIAGPVAEIALVWKPSMPSGVWGVFLRENGSSITKRMDVAMEYVFRMAAGEDPIG